MLEPIAQLDSVALCNVCVAASVSILNAKGSIMTTTPSSSAETAASGLITQQLTSKVSRHQFFISLLKNSSLGSLWDKLLASTRDTILRHSELVNAAFAFREVQCQCREEFRSFAKSMQGTQELPVLDRVILRCAGGPDNSSLSSLSQFNSSIKKAGLRAPNSNSSFSGSSSSSRSSLRNAEERLFVELTTFDRLIASLHLENRTKIEGNGSLITIEAFHVSKAFLRVFECLSLGTLSKQFDSNTTSIMDAIESHCLFSYSIIQQISTYSQEMLSTLPKGNSADAKAQLIDDLFELSQYALKARLHFISSAHFPDDKARQTQMDHMTKQRAELCWMFVEDGSRLDYAAQLSEQFKEFSVLVSLWELEYNENPENYTLLDRFLNLFGMEFSDFLFNSLEKSEKWSLILQLGEKYPEYLRSYAQDKPGIAWLHSIKQNDFVGSMNALSTLSKYESKNVERKQAFSSLAKLAALSIEDDDESASAAADVVEQSDQLLYLILVQRNLNSEFNGERLSNVFASPLMEKDGKDLKVSAPMPTETIVRELLASASTIHDSLSHDGKHDGDEMEIKEETEENEQKYEKKMEKANVIPLKLLTALDVISGSNKLLSSVLRDTLLKEVFTAALEMTNWETLNQLQNGELEGMEAGLTDNEIKTEIANSMFVVLSIDPDARALGVVRRDILTAVVSSRCDSTDPDTAALIQTALSFALEGIEQ
eukprot:TRINITY_DN2087_c0_g1_i3.p1 TRINITY_DN2087_c0_g1~~TRINITY_DN2087_c0_g1_i3.p1  ORF type:complete len:712 (-),score=243.98 TRINITY_DN2087_c0_g1_i3:82-2217(-)